MASLLRSRLFILPSLLQVSEKRFRSCLRAEEELDADRSRSAAAQILLEDRISSRGPYLSKGHLLGVGGCYFPPLGSVCTCNTWILWALGA